MSNPSKAKGTAGETATVKWLRGAGFPFADRQPLRGSSDAGDIAVAPGIVAEVKNVAVAGRGQVPKAMLTRWMGECEAERRNAGAAHCVLIVKRAGTTDVGSWFAYLPAWGFVHLVADPSVAVPDPWAPLCTDVATVARLLRWAGYGSPLEEVSA